MRQFTGYELYAIAHNLSRRLDWLSEMEHALEHAHRAELDATLDFVNTLEFCSTRTHTEYGGAHEALRTPDDVASWLAARHLLHGDRLPAAGDRRGRRQGGGGRPPVPRRPGGGGGAGPP